MDAVLIGVRFSHFSAAMLLFGIAAFEAGLLPAELRTRLDWWKPLRAALVAVLVVTAGLWFMLETAGIGNGWSDALNPQLLAAVATDTAFGEAWMVHLALTALLVPASWLRGDAGRVIFALAVAVVLGSLGFVGHATMQDGAEGLVHRLNQVVHLLAAGFWAGALLPVLACLLVMRTARQDAVVALRRFSGLGHVAVALTLVTGVVNTALVLGTWPVDFASPYQALLAGKIVLVLAMVGLALFNRYVSTPRLKVDADKATRALVAGTIGEIVLGAAVIALVSAFATFDPV